MESKIFVIKNSDLKKVFDTQTRQYVVGNFTNPQPIGIYSDPNIEVGITQYTEYTTELPHYHTTMTEYEYVIEGETKYKDLDTGEVFYLPKSSFYIIPPNTRYAQKSLANTKIIFIKHPGGNDKHLVDVDTHLQDWYSAWDK